MAVDSVSAMLAAQASHTTHPIYYLHYRGHSLQMTNRSALIQPHFTTHRRHTRPTEQHLKTDHRGSAVSLFLPLSPGHIVLAQTGKFKRPDWPQQTATRCFMWQVEVWLVAGGRQFKHPFKPITEQDRGQCVLVDGCTSTSQLSLAKDGWHEALSSFQLYIDLHSAQLYMGCYWMCINWNLALWL